MAEMPIAVVTLVFASLCLLQVVAHLHCRAAVGHAAVAVARIASTSSAVAGSDDALREYAESLLEDLPRGSAYYRRGSLRMSITGGPSSGEVRTVLSVEQSPLPVVGMLLANTEGVIVVRAVAVTQGAEVSVDPSYDWKALTIGAEVD